MSLVSFRQRQQRPYTSRSIDHKSKVRDTRAEGVLKSPTYLFVKLTHHGKVDKTSPSRPPLLRTDTDSHYRYKHKVSVSKTLRKIQGEGAWPQASHES